MTKTMTVKPRTAKPARWSAELAAQGHAYRGPGYCFTCGVREDLHARRPSSRSLSQT